MTTIYVREGVELPRRKDFDFYPTPKEVCEAALGYLPDDVAHRTILDPGAGTGVWGAAARKRWPDSHITGIDVRDIPQPAAYSQWVVTDFLLMDAAPDYDLVIGNPPYKYAEQFVRQSLDMLTDDGYCVMLLRLNFLESQKRAKGLWRTNPPLKVVVLSKRVSFTGDGLTNATAYAFYIWKTGWHGEPTIHWSL